MLVCLNLDDKKFNSFSIFLYIHMLEIHCESKKHPTESVSERILKIGEQLAKLQTKV